MLNLFVFSPIALEIGRGGEISSMELAAGLQDFYKVTFIDTNHTVSLIIALPNGYLQIHLYR